MVGEERVIVDEFIIVVGGEIVYIWACEEGGDELSWVIGEAFRFEWDRVDGDYAGSQIDLVLIHRLVIFFYLFTNLQYHEPYLKIEL